MVMGNPYLREARGLKSFFKPFDNNASELNELSSKSMNFYQLINEHTDLKLPAGKSLKQKIHWAQTHFSEKISVEDYGHTPHNQVKQWQKWKKLISSFVLKEAEESINEVSVNPAPPAVELAEQVVDEVSVNPAPPAVELAEQVVNEVSVNPAPPAVELAEQVVNEVSVNPAPPAVELAEQIVNEVSVNPAPPAVELVEPVIDEVSVNPAPPAVELAEQVVDEVSVNPAPPLIETDSSIEFIITEERVLNPSMTNDRPLPVNLLNSDFKEDLDLDLDGILNDERDDMDKLLNGASSINHLTKEDKEIGFAEMENNLANELVQDIIFVE